MCIRTAAGVAWLSVGYQFVVDWWLYFWSELKQMDDAQQNLNLTHKSTNHLASGYKSMCKNNCKAEAFATNFGRHG